MLVADTIARVEDSSWTRPQRFAVAAYGVWVSVLTVVLALWLENPHRNVGAMQRHGLSSAEIQRRLEGHGYRQGLVAVAVEVVLYLLIAYGAYRNRNWPFWPAVVLFGITGLGAVWVPLRPEAHAGLGTGSLIVHVLADLPGLFVASWLLVGLVRYRHTWARR
ncbi:hypothetical protein OG474_05740 [Kribbella sp. NBC_01505]|uniref:hypothetical protein n=1 Tax=Kribbella sp. NBC_01505 TaxID=2903580 RepID=UPI00386DB191